MDHYRLLGGMLKVDGKVVGAALGEIVHDTLFVHVERADRDITGVTRCSSTSTPIRSHKA
jgi:hypothetical protein